MYMRGGETAHGARAAGTEHCPPCLGLLCVSSCLRGVYIAMRTPRRRVHEQADSVGSARGEVQMAGPGCREGRERCLCSSSSGSSSTWE